MVAAGLYLSFHGLGRISARVTDSLTSFWSMAEYVANTLIFFGRWVGGRKEKTV